MTRNIQLNRLERLEKVNNLIYLRFLVKKSHSHKSYYKYYSAESRGQQLWHRKMIHYNKLPNIIKEKILKGVNFK